MPSLVDSWYARRNPLYAVSLKTGASKRVDKDRKTLLMAIYKRLHQVGDGRIVKGKHVVMHAPSGFKTFVLEDMTDDELKELGAKLAGRRSNPTVMTRSGSIEMSESDPRIQAYNALSKASERMGRAMHASRVAKHGAKKATSFRAGRPVSMADVTAGHRAVTKAMSDVLSGKITPEEAMGLLHEYDVKKQRLAGRPNPRIIDADKADSTWVSDTIDNAYMTYEAGKPIEKDRPIGDGYRLSVSRDDKNGLIGWILDDSSNELVGAGSLRWRKGKPRVILAAIESSASGIGLYPKILRALRSILGVPIQSDVEVTEAARKAWKKAGGKLKRLRGGGSVMRINPAKRPNPRPKTIFQSGPPLPDDPFAYFRKQSGFRELDVKAIDNHGRKYPVVIYNSDSKMPTLRGKIVLKIIGTPGSWFLYTILEGGVPAKLAIDFGSNWIWDNVREVIAAI